MHRLYPWVFDHSNAGIYSFPLLTEDLMQLLSCSGGELVQIKKPGPVVFFFSPGERAEAGSELVSSIFSQRVSRETEYRRK